MAAILKFKKAAGDTFEKNGTNSDLFAMVYLVPLVQAILDWMYYFTYIYESPQPQSSPFRCADGKVATFRNFCFFFFFF